VIEHNVDGSNILENTRNVKFGSLFMDHRGEWVCYLFDICRVTTILFVELLAIINSLSITCQNDINYIIFESDSQSVLIGVHKDPLTGRTRTIQTKKIKLGRALPDFLVLLKVRVFLVSQVSHIHQIFLFPV
jgi:hypothetical protein